MAQTWINNGPFGGYVTAIAVDPIDTNIVYAGTYGAGMFQSLDGGVNWKPINIGIPIRTDTSIGFQTLPSRWFGYYYPITLIRIDPNNTSKIFIGTQGKGIFQSSDYGENWLARNNGLPEGYRIRDLWIHPLDSEILFCGSKGLYRSSDGGLSWTLIDTLFYNVSSSWYNITTITNEPGNPNTLYVGIHNSTQPGLAYGLLRSTDGGNSWEILSQNDYTFYDLHIDPDSLQKLWSVVYTEFLDWMLFYSNNGGYNWYPFWGTVNHPWIEVGFLYADVDFNMYVENGYGKGLLIKSTDHGKTWSSLNYYLPFVEMVANPLDTQVLYFATTIGVYRSDDGGHTVRLMEKGMINSYISDVEVNPKDHSILYAGGGQGLWKSVDGGDSWIRLGTYEVTSLAIDPQHPDTIYWGGNKLMRSFDGGNTWEDIGNRFGGTITAIEVHPDSSNILFVGVYPSTLYKTNNWGYSWSVSYSPAHVSFWIEDIAIDPQNPQVIYFGASGPLRGLYKSINRGVSWSKISDPGEVKSIALHPSTSETVYVATKSKIMVSYDGGLSFLEIGQEIPSNNMSKVIINSFNPLNLFVGTRDRGVYYTIDSGQSWQSFSGSYNLRVTDIFLLPLLNRIYLATNGAGVWRGDNIITKLKQSIESDSHFYETIYLLPGYPNPFNFQTLIPFYVKKQSNVEAFIYNIRGELIKKFNTQKYGRGYHQITWDGKNEKGTPTSSGIYFIVLKSKTHTKSQKLLLVR